MIELLIELLGEFLGEVLLQALVEAPVEGVFECLRHAFRRDRKAHPVLAAIGLMILGTAAGVVVSLVLPHRITRSGRFPGVSLILAPLAVGWLMHVYGAWRRSRGGQVSSLATFHGGAAFAFAMASVRWLIVGRG